MFRNISFTFLLFLSSSYSLKAEDQEVCSPPIVEPSPVQHLWAEDGLEVCKIFLPALAIPGAGVSNGMAGGADLINQGLAAASTVPPVVFSLPW